MDIQTINKLIFNFVADKGVNPNAVMISDNVIKEIVRNSCVNQDPNKIDTVFGLKIYRLKEDDIVKPCII